MRLSRFGGRPDHAPAIAASTLLGACAALLGACAAVAPLDRPAHPTDTVAEATSRATAPPSSVLPPLEAEPLVSLAVKRHGTAVVSVPVGATGPRPVIVAAHGAGDRPDEQCRHWRAIVGDGAFVLCPRGFPINPHMPEGQTGFFYTTHHQLGDEVTAALAALAERFPWHADLAAPLYAGFSQGAIMGALLLPGHPARFTRAVLIEGGYGLFQEWNRFAARSFKRRGGERILLVCGRADCAARAAVSARYMRAEGVEARVVTAEGAGHTYLGAVAGEVASAFPWVVAGDARFTATGAKSADGRAYLANFRLQVGAPAVRGLPAGP